MSDDLHVERVLDEGTPEERAALRREAAADAELHRSVERTQALLQALRALPLDESSMSGEEDSASVSVARAAAAAAAASNEETAREEIAASHKRKGGSLGVLGRRVGWMALGAATTVVTVIMVTTPPEPSSSPPLAGWLATEVSGAAWVTSDTGRRALLLGDVVLPGSRLNTEAGGRVRLGRGDRIAVVLDPDSALTVLPAVDGETVVVEAGSLEGSQAHDRPLQIRVRGSLHWLEVEDGAARVLRRHQGAAVATCLTGRVTVDRDTPLLPGTVLELGPAALASARVLPAELALFAELARPDSGLQDSALLVRGQTDPGAEVEIQGEAVVVDGEGRFAATLADGTARVTVEVRDVLGRQRHEVLAAASLHEPVERRSPGRRSPAVETEWQWDPAPREPG